MPYEYEFLWSLFATLLAEVPVACIYIKYTHPNIKISDIIFSGIIASSLTLPYFWFVLPIFITSRLPYVLLGESAIVIIEAYVYYRILKIPARHAFLVSLIANIASVIVGLFLAHIHIL